MQHPLAPPVFSMSFLLTSLVRSLIFRLPGVRLLTVAAGLFIVLDIFLYIAMALGLYNMAKRQHLRCAALAWIPVLQLYVIGLLADQVTGGRFYRLMLCCFAGGTCATFLFMLAAASSPWFFAWGWLTLGLLITLLVFYFKALYWIYAQFSKSPRALLVLSIIFGFLGPIFVFALRDKSPKPLRARALR